MTETLKLIFMGTPEFALPTLEALASSPHQIVAVYTQPPRPAGRGQKERLSPVHAYAQSRGIPVFTPVSLKSPEMQEQFRALGADAAIVAAYGLLLPKAILDATPMGCINVHPSLLPRWRGAAPIARTVMAGDRETGIVIMQMNAGLDTGDMLLVKQYAVDEHMTAGRLHDELARKAGPLVLETLDGLRQKTITPVKQSEEGITYAHKISKEEAHIDWNQPAPIIRQKILGLNPFPGAYVSYKGENIKILDAQMLPQNGGKVAGEILDEQFHIACKEGIIVPLLMQRPGKKAMAVSELLKGFSISAGDVLT